MHFGDNFELKKKIITKVSIFKWTLHISTLYPWCEVIELYFITNYFITYMDPFLYLNCLPSTCRQAKKQKGKRQRNKKKEKRNVITKLLSFLCHSALWE